MAVKFTFADVRSELHRMALDAERHARLAPTQREKRWHSGRFSAFREALEMYDAAQRSVALNGPVEMRTFSEIEDEING